MEIARDRYLQRLESGVDERHVVEVASDDRANKDLRDPDALLAFLRSSIPADGLPTYVILDEYSSDL